MTIVTTVGSFDWQPGWGDLPSEVAGCDVPAVAVGPDDRVFVLSRSPLPVVVLDPTGAFVTGWGAGDFARPHGVHVAPDGSLWCADDEGQRLLHYSATGKLLRVIQGEDNTAQTGYVPGYPRSVLRSAGPFCYPTGIATGDAEDLWVTDGYGNARVHHFDRDGELLGSFGNPGGGPVEFVIPHGLLHLPTGHLLVSDRENERVQEIDPSGVMVASWEKVYFPNNIATVDHSVYYVAELGNVIQGPPTGTKVVADAPHARVTARDKTGTLLAEILPLPGKAPDIFFAPHGIAIGSHGDLYVGQVRAAYSRGMDRTGGPCLGKLVRVPDSGTSAASSS